MLTSLHAQERINKKVSCTLGNIQVFNLMSHELITLSPEDTLTHADDIMTERGIRHLPVIDEERKLIGLLTDRDILSVTCRSIVPGQLCNRTELLNDIFVKDVMRGGVLSISPRTSLKKAAQMMLENKIGSLLVVSDEEELIGIITESDFVNFFVSDLN